MTDRSNEIRRELQEAKAHLQQLLNVLVGEHTPANWDACEIAQAEVQVIERKLAESLGEPYAVPFDFPVEWDVGAPLPYLLCNDYKTYLTFFVSVAPDPEWDGSTIKLIDQRDGEPASLCLVTFESCVSAKLGHPNEQAQRGHPLDSRGRDGYTAQIVKNSPWIAEVARINKADDSDYPPRWEDINHYVFWFHDSTFECLADGYDVELTNEPLAELLDRVQQRLLD